MSTVTVENAVNKDNNSWGASLWDGYCEISNHTFRGLEFCDTFLRYLKERTAIESDYSSKLSKLSNKYKPSKGSKDDDDIQFTYIKSFIGILEEIQGIANQHDTISSRLYDDIIKPLSHFVSQTKSERKQLLHRYNELKQNMEISTNQLNKSKEDYRKSFAVMEKHYERHVKAEADDRLSRQEQKRIKHIYTEKTMQCEMCKQTYAAQLEKTNTDRQQYYSNDVPLVLNQMQNLDERRIKRLQEGYVVFAQIQKNISPIINSCISGLENYASQVNELKDSENVIKRYYTGYRPPGDDEFEELISAASDKDKRLTSGRHHQIPSKGTIRIRGLWSGNKPEEVREDFGHLPPAQQVRKLSKKIDELTSQRKKENGEKLALEKLYDVYKRDNKMGDPASLEPRRNEISTKIEQLSTEIDKFQKFLKIAHERLKNGGVITTVPDSSEAGSSLSRTSSERSAPDGGPTSTANASCPGLSTVLDEENRPRRPSCNGDVNDDDAIVPESSRRTDEDPYEITAATTITSSQQRNQSGAIITNDSQNLSSVDSSDRTNPSIRQLNHRHQGGSGGAGGGRRLMGKLARIVTGGSSPSSRRKSTKSTSNSLFCASRKGSQITSDSFDKTKNTTTKNNNSNNGHIKNKPLPREPSPTDHVVVAKENSFDSNEYEPSHAIPDDFSEYEDSVSHLRKGFENDDNPSQQTNNQGIDEISGGIMGSATALYSFDPTSLNEPFENAIAMTEGEHIFLLSPDLDGWTQIRRNNFEEGYAPTSYLTELSYFSSNGGEDVYEVAAPVSTTIDDRFS